MASTTLIGVQSDSVAESWASSRKYLSSCEPHEQRLLNPRKRMSLRVISVPLPPISDEVQLPHLRSYGAEAQDGQGEEEASNQRDDDELRPNHVDAGTAIKDRLRKGHEMS